MKTATLINKSNSETMLRRYASRRVYRLSHPLNGYEYVVVSAANTPDHGDETYIFGSNENGEILNWEELEGSYVGELNHEKALANAGYEVVKRKKK